MKEQEKEQESIIGANPVNTEEIPAAPVDKKELKNAGGASTQAIDEKEVMRPK